MDLRWPKRRLGVFCDGTQPADVFGLTLVKDDCLVETAYSGIGGDANPVVLVATTIPRLRLQKAA